MQMHHHRSEHWVVVHGTAKVSIGGEEKLRARERVRLHRRHPVAPPREPRQDAAARSSRCRSAAIWARTTSCAATTSTTAPPTKRDKPDIGIYDPGAHFLCPRQELRREDALCVAFWAQSRDELCEIPAGTIAAGPPLADSGCGTTGSGAFPMRIARACIVSLILAGMGTFLAVEARAQPAGLNAGRDCQVVRSCNFGRHGAYRGCLSSYTCRVCRFVPSRCTIEGIQRVCQRMRCTWGG